MKAMQENRLLRLVGDVDARYIEEAAPTKNAPKSREPARCEKPPRCTRRKPFGRSAIAAVLILCFLVGGVCLLLPSGSMTVTAYAAGQDQEIPSAGASFTTGSVDASGNLHGHPLLFHLAGENIDTVRFSCQNGQLNFMDLTEHRDEYGFAQNFTVRYGADADEYSSLLIDWLPSHILAALKDEAAAIADLPAESRRDRIVMQITFANGKTLVRSISVFLDDDGSFRAAFDAYTISAADAFVRRADSEPIPRDRFYSQGEMTVAFCDKNGAEVLPDGGWYVTDAVDSIAVSWNGRTPEKVQLLFTPSGTETAKEMDFLPTEAISAENKVVISADALHRDSLMGHLQILIHFGSSTIKSKVYNVIYQP